MAGTPKHKLNKISGEMERDNKEVYVQIGMNSAAFLLRAKNRSGSWYEHMKMVHTDKFSGRGHLQEN